MINNTQRQIIIYGDDFSNFYNKQSKKIREKIDWTIGLVRDIDRVPEKYLKHMEGTKDL